MPAPHPKPGDGVRAHGMAWASRLMDTERVHLSGYATFFRTCSTNVGFERSGPEHEDLYSPLHITRSHNQIIKQQSQHAKISAVPYTRRSLHSFNPTCVFATVVESKRLSIAAAVTFMASIADCGVTALPASSFRIISMLLRRSLCSLTACIPRGHPGSARGPYVRDP